MLEMDTSTQNLLCSHTLNLSNQVLFTARATSSTQLPSCLQTSHLLPMALTSPCLNFYPPPSSNGLSQALPGSLLAHEESLVQLQRQQTPPVMQDETLPPALLSQAGGTGRLGVKELASEGHGRGLRHQEGGVAGLGPLFGLGMWLLVQD